MYTKRQVNVSNSLSVEESNNINKKIKYLYKLYFALRLRKAYLPSLISLRKEKKSISLYYRTFFRKSQLYFYLKRRKKTIRRRKIPRLKSVHFYVPSYIHRDFRTLRAVKLQTATVEDIYHPFRNSLVKIHSFYRSRGF